MADKKEIAKAVGGAAITAVIAAAVPYAQEINDLIISALPAVLVPISPWIAFAIGVLLKSPIRYKQK